MVFEALFCRFRLTLVFLPVPSPYTRQMAEQLPLEGTLHITCSRASLSSLETSTTASIRSHVYGSTSGRNRYKLLITYMRLFHTKYAKI